MYRKFFVLCLVLSPAIVCAQLVVQKGASLFVDRGEGISVQGDVEVHDDVKGEGAITLHGDIPQSVSVNKHTLPVLVVDNAAGITLTSDLTISRHIELRRGLLHLGANTLLLSGMATAAANASSYVVTRQGRVVKTIDTDLESFLLPVGIDNAYTPLFLKTGGVYHAATIEVQAKPNESVHKPLSADAYIGHHWTVRRTGIHGAVAATAFYKHAVGAEESLAPFY